MKNFYAKGETIAVTTPSGGYTSGQPVVVGDTIGVSAGTYVETETAVINMDGVYTLPKVASGAIAVGKKVYLVVADGNITGTASTNIFAGYAYEAAADGATTINVLLAR